MSEGRKFKAATMRAALELVKRELGPHAVILKTGQLAADAPGSAGRRWIEIVAAPSADAAPGPRPAGPHATEDHGLIAPTRSSATRRDARPPAAAAAVRAAPTAEPAPALREAYLRLVQNEVGEALAKRIVAAVDATAQRDPEALRAALHRCVAEMLPAVGGVAPAPGETRRIALVGPPGGGKTTTLAKLAAHLKLRKRLRVALLSLDLHRLAAHEQLRRYADIIDVRLFTAQRAERLRTALGELDETDVLLVDTPGIGSRDASRMARLDELLAIVRPHETHLVLPATLAPPVQERMAALFAPLGAARVVLTHLDDAVGFGVVLNALQHIGLSLSYVSVGQRVPNDLEEACSNRLASLICSPTGAAHASAAQG
ncbi:MAG: AAA family ATPase [Phycisphaerae bacterium]